MLLRIMFTCLVRRRLSRLVAGTPRGDCDAEVGHMTVLPITTYRKQDYVFFVEKTRLKLGQVPIWAPNYQPQRD
jgi:hypothetical protein